MFVDDVGACMTEPTPPPPSGGPPPTPDGYADPYLFEYSVLVLFLLALPMFALSAGVFGWVLLTIQSPEVFATVFTVTELDDGTAFALDVIGAGVPFLIAFVVVAVVHELIHGAVMQYFGKEVTYGVNPAMGAFYTSAFGQFQAREELFPIGAAPLVIITLVATPLLAVPVPVVALTAYLVLVFNTTGAVGDLYVLWRLRRMPSGTLMYDVDLRHWYVFEPLDPDTVTGVDDDK